MHDRLIKIVFICGSLEPGRDGVGDYTRRLAGELIRQGHQAAAAAIYDPHIHDELVGNQPVNGIDVPVLRMPSGIGAMERFQRVEEWIERFGPGWLSVQFVPYAFHPKGLPLLLDKQLKGLLVKGRLVHIMFHETWVGIENSRNWKRLVTAALQKMFIIQMIRTLHPDVIHTQLPKTYFDLERITPKVKQLPLFSNIEVTRKPQTPEHGILRIGMFSQAEASGSIISFLTSLGKKAEEMHIRTELLLIGGEGAHMKTVGKIFENIGNLKDRVSYTGFLVPEALSLALQSCSLGVTVVPRHALGKSGSVAAFLAHGIPVAAPVIHRSQHPMEIGFFSIKMRSAIMLEPDFISLAKAKEAAMAARHEIQLSTITKSFIANLQHPFYS